MEKYLRGKAEGFTRSSEEGKNLYFIPMTEEKNVLKHLRKHKAAYSVRYNWNYTLLIIHY